MKVTGVARNVSLSAATLLIVNTLFAMYAPLWSMAGKLA